VCSIGLVGDMWTADKISYSWLLFVLLRWSFGLVGVLALVWMAWQTLKIPNTQSATGILYVAVIGVFVGELTGLLLSAESAFPL
jgi:Co/Zn/Cd efflux system component